MPEFEKFRTVAVMVGTLFASKVAGSNRVMVDSHSSCACLNPLTVEKYICLLGLRYSISFLVSEKFSFSVLKILHKLFQTFHLIDFKAVGANGLHQKICNEIFAVIVSNIEDFWSNQ